MGAGDTASTQEFTHVDSSEELEPISPEVGHFALWAQEYVEAAQPDPVPHQNAAHAKQGYDHEQLPDNECLDEGGAGADNADDADQGYYEVPHHGDVDGPDAPAGEKGLLDFGHGTYEQVENICLTNSENHQNGHHHALKSKEIPQRMFLSLPETPFQPSIE